MDISIIIVNYNTLPLVIDVIRSIKKNLLDIKYEILLIDNDSKDGTREYFSTNNIEKLKFIPSCENLGFGRANNLGIKKAKGKYIFLLNSDTLLIDNSVSIMFRYMEENEDIGVCGANLYNKKMEPVHSYGRKIPGLFYDFNEIIKKIYTKIVDKRLDFNYSNKIKEVGYITGADMFIRKEVLDLVGGFDEDFFMYFEETELSSRIKKMGYKIVNIPAAKIIHFEGASFEFKENRFRMSNESKHKFFKKVYGEKYQLANYIISQVKYLLCFNSENRIKARINKENYIKYRKK